jgi:hypothetical protein
LRAGRRGSGERHGDASERDGQRQLSYEQILQGCLLNIAGIDCDSSWYASVFWAWGIAPCPAASRVGLENFRVEWLKANMNPAPLSLTEFVDLAPKSQLGTVALSQCKKKLKMPLKRRFAR